MTYSNDVPKSLRESKGNNILIDTCDYVAIDIETTGLAPAYDAIIELAAIRYRNSEEIESFQTLVNPGFEIDAYISELTGISNEMLSTAPCIAEVLSDFVAFVGCDILVGHNANFDVNFIYDNCVAQGISLFSNDFIDTMRLSRRLLPNLSHHRLKDIICHFGIEDSVKHRALEDARQAASCFSHLKQHMTLQNISMQDLCAKKSNGKPAQTISTDNTVFDESTPVFGKTFVFTGVLDDMQRRDAMQIVTDLGGFCGDGVTQKTNYLVLGCNDYCKSIKDGKSSKQKKAEKLKLDGYDIEIIPESVFYEMVQSCTQ